MNKFGEHCIDCGSEAVHTTIDDVMPAFRMEIVDFACGAVLKTTFSNNGNMARVTLSGCTRNYVPGASLPAFNHRKEEKPDELPSLQC